jgi:hypothetical protein
MSDDASRQLPSDQEVIAALERTGFLLEQRVAKCLQGYEFHAEIGSAYPDPETGKSREIDVQASRLDDVEHEKIAGLVHIDLIIECKNTTAPFVLVGQTIPGHRWLSYSVFLSFDPLRLKFPGKNPPLEYYLGRLQVPSAEESFVGTSFYE